jgi:NitT/TauT family transport system substrate-binding protein
MLIRKTFIGTLVACAGALGATPAVPQTEPALRVATSPSDSFSEAVYAENAGFFKAAGLNVELVSLANSGSIGAAVAGGAVDIGVGNVISIANARAQGLTFSIIAPSAIYTGKEPATVLIVGKTSPVTSAKDLEGKTIATIELRGTMQSAIREWMTKNGADPSGLKFIEAPFTTMPAMVNAGRVDAAMIGEPALTSARPVVRILANPYEAISSDWYLNVWFANADWLEKNRATARKFVAAIAKAAAWSNAHRSETGAMLQKSLPLSDDVLAKMTRTRYGVGKLDVQQIQPVLDTAARYGVLKAPVDANTLIFPGL